MFFGGGAVLQGIAMPPLSALSALDPPGSFPALELEGGWLCSGLASGVSLQLFTFYNPRGGRWESRAINKVGKEINLDTAPLQQSGPPRICREALGLSGGAGCCYPFSVSCGASFSSPPGLRGGGAAVPGWAPGERGAPGLGGWGSLAPEAEGWGRLPRGEGAQVGQGRGGGGALGAGGAGAPGSLSLAGGRAGCGAGARREGGREGPPRS